jgi:hypothetical protein
MTITDKTIRQYKGTASIILALTTLVSTIWYKFSFPLIKKSFEKDPFAIDIINLSLVFFFYS